MLDHLNVFNKLLYELLNLHEQLEDNDKAFLLLNSLRDLYEHLATTLSYEKDSIKFKYVSNALINNEFCKRYKQAQSDMSKALEIRCRSKSKK